MLRYKAFVLLIVFCIVHGSTSKPFDDSVVEGRGIGSTIWGWITYPFYWWSSSENLNPPENDQLIGSTPIHTLTDIEIGKRNVTVWCNDQTCTTMRCESFGCVNVTCNIYDTDLLGECRNYNTGIVPPEEPTTVKVPVAVTQPLAVDVEINSKPPIVISTTSSINDTTVNEEERPLELEAILSSTVSETPQKVELTDPQDVQQ